MVSPSIACAIFTRCRVPGRAQESSALEWRVQHYEDGDWQISRQRPEDITQRFQASRRRADHDEIAGSHAVILRGCGGRWIRTLRVARGMQVEELSALGALR